MLGLFTLRGFGRRLTLIEAYDLLSHHKSFFKIEIQLGYFYQVFLNSISNYFFSSINNLETWDFSIFFLKNMFILYFIYILLFK